MISHDLGRDAKVAGIELEFLNLALEGFRQFAIELNREVLGHSGKRTVRGRAFRIINRTEEPGHFGYKRSAKGGVLSEGCLGELVIKGPRQIEGTR